jgi:hypothetical protein
MKRMSLWSMLVLGLVLMAGCGKSESSSSDSGSDASNEPAAPVSNESQLVGTWFQAAEQDLAGVEFGKDGKATLMLGSDNTGEILQAVTLDYSVLDGGRVRMVVPQGQTVVFNCEISGNRLMLDPETRMMGLIGKSVFTRLEGQTVAQALRARAQQEQQKRQALVESVQKFLGQPNLVLASADPKLNLSRYALELTGSASSWRGVIYSEYNPPLKREVTASVQLRKGDVPQVVLSLGNVVGPVGEGPRNPMTITLVAEGDGEAMKLHEKGLALKSDAQIHAAILANYESTQKQRQQAVETFADRFKMYCQLEGELTYPNNPNGRPVQIRMGLLRIEGKPAFAMADLRNNDNPLPGVFNQPAVVQWENNKPMLALPYMQGLLEPGEEGQVIGKLNGMNATLKITQCLSKEELTQRSADTVKFLDQQVANGVELRGQAMINSTHPYPMPLFITLKSKGKQQLGGTVSILHLGGEYELEGSAVQTLLGAAITLKSTKNIKHSGTGLLGRGRDFNLDLLWVDGKPKITGKQSGFQGASVELELVDNDRLAAEIEKMESLLEKGVTFAKVNLGDSSQPFQFDLKMDGQRNITGTFSGDNQNPAEGAKVTGELSNSDGFVFLKLQKAAGVDTRKRPTAAMTFWLWAMTGGEQINLGGYDIPAGRNPPTPDPVLLQQAEP